MVGVVISHLTLPPPPHPQNLSHIFYTMTFMFECQGRGGVGVYKKWQKFFTDPKLNVEHPQHLSHIYDTLTCLSVGAGVLGGL